MWYMPYLRVRRAVIVYTLLAVGVSLALLALRYWPGAVRLDAADAHHLGLVDVDVATLLTGAAALVGGLATVLGLNLAAENDGHLEQAWSKPVTRERYALGVFAVDLAAIAACIGATVVCAAIVIDASLGRQAIVVDARALLPAFAYCGLPVCVYAWITALSASLKRNRATVSGLFWPVMFAVALIQLIRVPVVHVLAGALNLVNPIALYAPGANGPQAAGATYLSGWLVAAVLLAVAVAQWRRLEM